MPLTKASGNMYGWVTHTHNHLSGECPHKCQYCYVGRSRFGRPKRYTGPVGIVESEFKVKYGFGRTIFLENCSDLFAVDVSDEIIRRVLDHAQQFPENTYVFQTKNPGRIASFEFMEFPERCIFGTTIESNHMWEPEMGETPDPLSRAIGMQTLASLFQLQRHPRFVTIEPILRFNTSRLVKMILGAKPSWVNIGADSKRAIHHSIEPEADQVRELIELLRRHNIAVRLKPNLRRILGEEVTA